MKAIRVKIINLTIIALLVNLLLTMPAHGINENDLELHGYAQLKYRVRWSENETDQDIYEYISMYAGDETTDKVSASIYGRMSGDIDGRRETDAYSEFREITDTYDDNINGRLYHAYLTIRELGTLSRVRFGRQEVYSGETLYFDGVKIDSKEIRDFLSISLYGGVPVHLYESSSSGDYLWGSGIEVKPRDGTLLRLDSIYVEDDSEIWGDHNDELFILSGWQDITKNARIYGKYSFLEKKERDAQLGCFIDIPEHHLTIEGSYFRQLEELRDFSLEFSPYYPVAGSYLPFEQYDVNVNKRICQNFGVGAGATIRELIDTAQETTYNHAFQRYYLSGSIYDLPVKGLNFTVTLDDWGTSIDDIRTVGLNGEYVLKKGWKLKAGSYYSLYKYDYYTGEENDDVRTAYIETTKKLSKNMDWKLRYEAEDDDFNVYHTVETSVKYNF